MAESFAVVCRSCGAPLEGFDSRAAPVCAYCGTSAPMDDATAARLRRHAAHIRRVEQMARALMRQHVIAAVLSQSKGCISVVIGLMLLLLFGAPPVVFLVPFVVLNNAVGALLGLIAGAIVFVVVAIVIYFLIASYGVHEDRKASLQARSCVMNLTTTIPTRCPHCGAYAAMVAIGDSLTLPCPYCQAPLVCASGDAQRAASDALLSYWQSTGDARMAQASMALNGKPTVPKIQVPGFEVRGGIYQGYFGGIPIYAVREFNEFGMLLRVEARADTALHGSVFLLPRTAAQEHWNLLQSFGVRAPMQRQSTDPEVDARFEVFADPTVHVASVVAHPAIRSLVLAAMPNESVTLDQAGGSCWRIHPSTRMLSKEFVQYFPSRAQGLADALSAR